MANYPGRNAVISAWNTFVSFYREWTSNTRGTTKGIGSQSRALRRK